jgi:hypothetical protein
VTISSTHSEAADGAGSPADVAAASGLRTEADSSIMQMVLELEIGVLALLHATTPAEGRDGIRSGLIEIFPTVGPSPRFATLKTRTLLRELGVVGTGRAAPEVDAGVGLRDRGQDV